MCKMYFTVINFFLLVRLFLASQNKNLQILHYKLLQFGAKNLPHPTLLSKPCKQHHSEGTTCIYLSISNSIPVDNNAFGQRSIGLVKLPQSIGHALLEVVSQLLASVLEHRLAEVPGV